MLSAGYKCKEVLTDFMIQMCLKSLLTQVSEAHESGRTFNCINPQNLALKSSGKLGIFDFSKIQEPHIYDLKGHSMTSNKLNYTSPEVIENPESVSQPADIFAIGCLFGNLLVG